MYIYLPSIVCSWYEQINERKKNIKTGEWELIIDNKRLAK